MEEGRPTSEEETAPFVPGEEPAITELQTEPAPEEPGRRSSGLIIAGYLVVVALVVIGLFLPPISLGERLGLAGSADVSPTAESEVSVVETAENQTTILGEFELTLGGAATGVTVSSLPPDDFVNNTVGEQWSAAVAALPQGLVLKSAVYTIDYDGDPLVGEASVSVPPDSGPPTMLDLYGWDGSAWVFIPSRLAAGSMQLVSLGGELPQALAIMEPAVADEPTVAAELLPTQTLPTEVLPRLTEVSVGTLTLVGSDDLQGSATATATGPYEQLLRVTNTGAIIDQMSLTSLLDDSAAQERQIDEIVNQVMSNGFAGVNLDFQGVPGGQGAAFNAFVANLYQALDREDLMLAITLGTPQQVNASWDSGGQDWVELGQMADVVYLQMPLDPLAYSDGGEAEQLVNWATRLIDRQKLTGLFNASAVDKIGESYRELSNDEALRNFGELQFTEGSGEIEPGTPVEVALSGIATPLEWDGVGRTYKYSYEQAGQTHHVWLGNEAALSFRTRLVNRYHLRGIALRGLGNVANGSGYVAVIDGFLEADDPLEAAGAAIVWTVRDDADSVLASDSGNTLTYLWDGTENPGQYTINADFALGENVSTLGSVDVEVLTLAEEEEEEVVADDEEGADDGEVTATSFDPGDADAVVNVNANVRLGPGLSYGTIAGGITSGNQVQLIGRNSDASWLQVILPDGQEGWIFATLLNVNQAFDIAGLEVVAVDPPAPAAGGGGGGGDTTASAPPPVNVAPVTNSGFELGGQTHTFANPTLMSYSGMNWVKFQHKWGSGDGPNAVAGRIQQAQANGFKVLLSIPGADHSSIDYNEYVNFLAGVAALGPNAIEVWNEQNIDREWPSGQIDPALYVNQMLAPAYNAIKAANPNVMVISGAPAPTGFFGGCGGGGCDDGPYMAGMAAAGAANYMDCIGIHYNEGIISPNQSSGDPRTEHYTRYFWGMVNTYWNAFGGSRPLCFTELGYLSGVDYGGVPGGFAWAGNTSIAQHAQWLAEAASLSASSGKVRMMIVFNVDFTHYSADPQAGYAMIRKDGSCPACETLRQVMGG